jgi:hypothetical protein
MATTILDAFEERLLAALGETVRRRVLRHDDCKKDLKFVGLPALVVADGGGKTSYTSESVIEERTVETWAVARGRPAAEALAADVLPLFDEKDGRSTLVIPGLSFTWVKPAGYRVTKDTGATPEDGDFRFRAVLTWSIRTEKARR